MANKNLTPDSYMQSLTPDSFMVQSSSSSPVIDKALATVPRPKASSMEEVPEFGKSVFGGIANELGRNDLVKQGQKQYAAESSHGMPGSFEGHPENIGEYVPQTIGEIAGGAKDIAQGNISRGLHRGITGAMNIPTPMLPIIGAGAPVPSMIALAAGVGGQKVTKAGAKLLGATEDQSDLAGDIGGIAVGYGGSKIPGVVSKAAPKLAQKIVDPLVYENLGETVADQRFGTDPARGLVDEGLVGTKKGLLDKSSARLGELKSRADNILQNHPNSRTLINTEPIIDNAINNAIGGARKLGSGDIVSRLEKLRGALKSEYGNLQGTPYEVNELKTKIQDSANQLGAYGNSVPADASAAAAMKEAAHGIRKAVDARVPEAAELNQRMSDLIDAKSGIQRRVNQGRGEDLFSNHLNSGGMINKSMQRTVGSAPVRTGIARILNAGNVKPVPEPTSYVPPQIKGLLKAAPIQLGSEMEPIGEASAPSPTLPYRPSLQQPSAFVSPSQIRPAGAQPELLFPNETPGDFPSGQFPGQGSLFQTPVEASAIPPDVAALERIRQANLANVPAPVKGAIGIKPSMGRLK